MRANQRARLLPSFELGFLQIHGGVWLAFRNDGLIVV